MPVHTQAWKHEELEHHTRGIGPITSQHYFYPTRQVSLPPRLCNICLCRACTQVEILSNSTVHHWISNKSKEYQFHLLGATSISKQYIYTQHSYPLPTNSHPSTPPIPAEGEKEKIFFSLPHCSLWPLMHSPRVLLNENSWRFSCSLTICKTKQWT